MHANQQTETGHFRAELTCMESFAMPAGVHWLACLEKVRVARPHLIYSKAGLQKITTATLWKASSAHSVVQPSPSFRLLVQKAIFMILQRVALCTCPDVGAWQITCKPVRHQAYSCASHNETSTSESQSFGDLSSCKQRPSNLGKAFSLPTLGSGVGSACKYCKCLQCCCNAYSTS